MRAALSTIGATLLGCATLWFSTDGFRAITAEGARRLAVAERPRPVAWPPLQSMSGEWLSPDIDTPALVEFIYTTCPTICQSSGGDFAELRNRLAAEELTVPMYSISFDPDVDGPAELRSYAEAHGASGDPWTLVRPEPDDLAALLSTFGVTVIPDGWGGYQHNVAVLLVNRDGAFAGAFDTRDFNEIAGAVEAAL